MYGVSYPWLSKTWRRLQQALEQDTLPSALLISANQGMGAQQVIDSLCATLLCTNGVTEPCGFCHACSLVEAGTHPDLHMVTPLEGKVGISVDQIRQCTRYALESSQLNGVRVIVISPAERMTEAAMNALLKTLEQPPEQCVFILSSHEAHRLLPTIRSRCQQWHVEPPTYAGMASWLHGQGVTQMPELYKVICAGAPLQLLTSQQQQEGFEKALTALSDFLFADFALPGDFTGLVLKGEALPTLSALSIALLELQKSYFVETPSVETHDQLRVIKDKLDYHKAHDMASRLNQLIEQLTTHSGLNQELLISQWLIESKC